MPVLRIQAWKYCEGATFRIPNAAVDFKKIEEMNTGTRVGVKKIDKFFIFYLNFNHDGSTVNFFTGAMFFYKIFFLWCCCCSSSFLLSFFSIACILVCALLDSNALVDSPCCNIAPCGSPCIFERYVHWVVVCCTTNNKWRKEEMLLLWVQVL